MKDNKLGQFATDRVFDVSDNCIANLPEQTLTKVCSGILANQNFALSIRGIEFETLYVNAACLELFGETREEWMEDDWERRYKGGQVAKIYDEVIPAVLAGNKWHGEFAITTPQGEEKQVLSDWDAIYNDKGEVICFYGLYTEVTHIKSLKEELVKQNQFLTEIIDTLPDPMIVKDKNHTWLAVNKAFCHVIGRSRKELLGKNDQDFLPANEVEVIWGCDDEAIRTGEEIINEESVTHKNGETRLLATKRVAITRSDGETLLIGIARDITTERDLQRSMADSYCKLETSLTALSYDLNRLQDDVATGVSKAEAIRGLFEHSNKDFAAFIKESELKTSSANNERFTPAHLSAREYQVFLLLVQGHRIKDVALHLGITANTASTYRSRIMKKLEMNSMTDMVQYAIRYGLI